MSVRNERGFALVLTLVVTALLIAVATEFIREAYVEMSFSRNYINQQQASLLAEGGIKGGMALIRQFGNNTADPQFLALVGQPQQLDDERGTVSVTIEDEGGKLNLNAVTLPNGDPNSAYDAVEQRLLVLLGLPAELHDTLADWVDLNDAPLPDGAETNYYRSLPTPYSAKNGPFDTFGELGLVKGITPPILNGLRGYCTVYGPDYPININTAPAKVLLALDGDMNDTLVKEIIDRRNTKPFTSTGELSNLAGMDRIFPRISGIIRVSGTVYRLVAEASVGEVKRIAEAVVTTDGNYLYWREY